MPNESHMNAHVGLFRCFVRMKYLLTGITLANGFFVPLGGCCLVTTFEKLEACEVSMLFLAQGQVLLRSHEF